MKEVVYHPLVPAEVMAAASYYEEISPKLLDEFWAELLDAIGYAQRLPGVHHFDPSGYRRSNLKRFPYHFLFKIYPDHIRIIVVRHNHRDPRFGLRRR